MRQFTTPEQTAKLIELGLEKPRNERWVLDVANESTPSIQNIVKRQDYSIGELIQMLPPKVGTWNLSIERYWEFELWIVSYNPCDCFSRATELRDALYNMIVKLKEDKIL